MNTAAQALGRMGAGKAKTITDRDRQARAARMKANRKDRQKQACPATEPR